MFLPFWKYNWIIQGKESQVSFHYLSSQPATGTFKLRILKDSWMQFDLEIYGNSKDFKSGMERTMD